MRQFLISAFIAFVSCVSIAGNPIEVTRIERASNYDLGDGSSRPVIYGGIAGPVEYCDTKSTTKLCNNCSLFGQNSCNENRIHPDLMLRIDFKVTADIQANHVFFGYANGTSNEFTTYTKSAGPFTKNSTGYIQISWGELCQAAYGDSNCSGGTNITGDDLTLLLSIEDSVDFDNAATTEVTLKIMAPTGIVSADTLACTDSSPSAGICGFNTYAGDKKVYISDLDIVGSCPSEFQFARVYYTTDYTRGLGAACYGSENYQDLPLNSDCAPKGDWIIDGLENGKPYMFRISILDIAGNVAFLSDQTDMQSSYPACVPPGSETAALANDAACPYIATPSATPDVGQK